MKQVVESPSQSLTSMVLVELEGDIISGRLSPRQRLVETELGVRFGISRAPVREALRMLENEGLVSRGPQGLHVAEVTLEEVTEIFEVLADLEELYTRKAVKNLAEEDISGMTDILRRMEECANEIDVQKYYDLNDQFHGVIRKACLNRQLIRLLDGLGKKTVRFRRLAMSMPGRLPNSLKEHKEILAAIEAKDPDGAGRHARRSAENAYHILTQFLKHSNSLL